MSLPPASSCNSKPLPLSLPSCYLQLAQYLDACFLFAAAEFHSAVELVVRVRDEERQSRGQPLLPALSIRLHGEADSCGIEELVGELLYLKKKTFFDCLYLLIFGL